MNLIVCVSENWGIGYQGDLLVKIPNDMRFFKEFTTEKAVVMGRRTFESLPQKKPLPNRDNYILSHSIGNVVGATISRSIPELFYQLSSYNDEEICVIGGQNVYDELIPFCHRAYITQFYTDNLIQADKFFPKIDNLPGWKVEVYGEIQEYQGIKYRFLQYINTNVKDFRPNGFNIQDIAHDIVEKNEVVFFLPKDIFNKDEYDLFCVELLDFVHAYLYPLKFGLTKEDINDYCEQINIYRKGFFDFLYDKRYIANSKSFVTLLEKYHASKNSNTIIPGYKVIFPENRIESLNHILYNSKSFVEILQQFDAHEGHYDLEKGQWCEKSDE